MRSLLQMMMQEPVNGVMKRYLFKCQPPLRKDINIKQKKWWYELITDSPTDIEERDKAKE